MAKYKQLSDEDLCRMAPKYQADRIHKLEETIDILNAEINKLHNELEELRKEKRHEPN